MAYFAKLTIIWGQARVKRQKNHLLDFFFIFIVLTNATFYLKFWPTIVLTVDMFICFEYTVHKGELPVLVATYLGKKKKKECRSGKRCDLWGLSLIWRMNNSFLIKSCFPRLAWNGQNRHTCTFQFGSWMVFSFLFNEKSVIRSNLCVSTVDCFFD